MKLIQFSSGCVNLSAITSILKGSYIENNYATDFWNKSFFPTPKPYNVYTIQVYLSGQKDALTEQFASESERDKRYNQLCEPSK